MISISKMSKEDIPILYDIALRAFAADYERFGAYPPVINVKKQGFLPPLFFGKTILLGDRIIGGAFAAGFGKKGEIGAIFIDPSYQHVNYGKQALKLIENSYSKVKKWKLDTPSAHPGLHRFYESLGYVKIGEGIDKKSGIGILKYEKTIT